MVTMILLVLAGCQSASKSPSPRKKVVLWDGNDFSGWYRYIADPIVDVNDVWRMYGRILHCTGQPDGYIRTGNKYRNYLLHLEWRWPGQVANSGILLHMTEPDQIWPTCVECQLKAGNAGDFVLMNGAGLTVNGIDRQDITKRFVVAEKMAPVSEKPVGQWNTCEIVCKRGMIRCFVNGVLQNEGVRARPGSGYIGLQSEGGPIEFRNIYLLPAR
ncbi:MAG: DUF1080 domain-containing protein [Sedimentisphaerales bacterium]|nr:DUF1080 domain-containing protein [Sedimentisphaerales bacterium]